MATGPSSNLKTSVTARGLQIGLAWFTDLNFLREQDFAPYPCDPRPVFTTAWSVYCVEQ